MNRLVEYNKIFKNNAEKSKLNLQQSEHARHDNHSAISPCACGGHCPRCSQSRANKIAPLASNTRQTTHSLSSNNVNVPTSSGSSLSARVSAPTPQDETSSEAPPTLGETPTQGDGATPVQQSSPCNTKSLSRDNYLKEPGTSTDDFGLTSLDPNAVTYPEFITEKTIGGVRIKPTMASLPTIPSVFTGSGNFFEGERTVTKQNPSDCDTKKYPIRWTISDQGAAKIAEGEQEHCGDFQHAFDISLKRYAEAINALAATSKVFINDADAKAKVVKAVGASPENWRSIFICLAGKTRMRDPHWHKPIANNRAPNWDSGCKFAISIISGNSLPEVGQHPASEIIKDCGEAGAAPATAPSNTRQSNDTSNPDLSTSNSDEVSNDE
jgi:hypothetical protein